MRGWHGGNRANNKSCNVVTTAPQGQNIEAPRWELMMADERVEHLCRQMDDVISDLQKLKKSQGDLKSQINEVIAHLNNLLRRK
jgi:hypothetical protein